MISSVERKDCGLCGHPSDLHEGGPCALDTGRPKRRWYLSGKPRECFCAGYIPFSIPGCVFDEQTGEVVWSATNRKIIDAERSSDVAKRDAA